MPNCKHHDVCGLAAEASFCILHSRNPEKDKEAFAAALEAHRKNKGDNFRYIVFPVAADFHRATFTKEADFSQATFRGRTLFAPRGLVGQIETIFSGAEVDFTEVVINPPDVVTFLEADLTNCRFLDTR